MYLERLHIEKIRNLETVVMKNLQPFTVLYGVNGSGKTSVLEAIHILATGRSFRTHMPKHYIQHHAPHAIIFAQTHADKVGVQKFSSGEQLIKINGDRVATQGQLAQLLPLQHIDPLTTDIIDHGSKPRRELLDWLMFHVEPSFYQVWLHYTRTLKQRNSMFKHYKKPSLEDLQPWNNLLAEYGEQLHLQRVAVFMQWQVFFEQEVKKLLPDLVLHLDYTAGFQTEIGLALLLEQQHHKDCERRYTEHGPHRADLKIKTEHGDATDMLSRGQKKLLMVALKLSQIAMLHASNKETVVLLDDITAELDCAAQQRLLTRLHTLGSQVFLTTLDDAIVKQHLHDLCISYQMFNVHAGVVQMQPSTPPEHE
ncbi:DNA replication/repair protein RecF [Acinetobacter rathckeae]|uniref:DNA replication/repair protein RecF n=1 Tax=Acinetobacter rathckeae TaxID=2605272 RepID=UPI0018A31AB3|nr:DNA replication/repair protein RecF [Acinetobacter rathckeae]MBF7689100.1 DNA replication/repair protein RecF [Acinetobacter rathckeae]MBF7696666.1 DNA replication/repair protein RecF [Acinetobacter rathckeae]